jgi:hypothetical protein
MSTEALLFAPACFALNMAPGPHHLLSISNATRHGFWTAPVAGIGRLLAFCGHDRHCGGGAGNRFADLPAAVLRHQAGRGGLPLLSDLSVVACLAGDRHTSRQRSGHAQHPLPGAAGVSGGGGQSQGDPDVHGVSATVHRPAGPQFALLGLLFLVMAWIAIAAYIGSHLRAWFSAPRRRRAFHRICASLLGAAGIGRLAARRSTAGLTTDPG